MNRRYCLFLLVIVPAFATVDAGPQSRETGQAVYDAGPCTDPGVPAGCSPEQHPAWYGLVRSVYVVTPNHYAEGIGVDTPKFGDLIAIEIFNPKDRAPEQQAVYNVGERLALFMGGERKGQIRIKKVLPFQCDSSAALVSADPPIQLAKDAMALATNSEKLRPHANRQHHPDATETNYARQLAMNEFLKHGVPEELANKIEVSQLIVTRIDNTDSDFLIGSLSVKAKDAEHRVFLIGKIDASGATTEMAHYHKTTDLLDGADSEYVRLVDQLDFDGDGTDEVVVEMRGYEDEEFGIYRRLNGVWMKCTSAARVDAENPRVRYKRTLTDPAGAEGPGLTLRGTAASHMCCAATSRPAQFLVSPDCIFDASLVPATCPGRLFDLKGLINKFLESRQIGKVAASTSFDGKPVPCPSHPTTIPGQRCLYNCTINV